ncbi:hypothetical protein [Acetobacter cibinongensis]|uniref:hypothetical protein n=1 Tax=Acetobacter cibinongensis TaxID=146475 RepID=UPI0015E1B480|nr:hypothetical protein [Acetobacter cibinongensis]
MSCLLVVSGRDHRGLDGHRQPGDDRRRTPQGPEQRGGRQDRNFLVPRGMGAAQGKKVAGRRCAIAGRGEAGLRADRPYREAMVCGTVSLVWGQGSPSCFMTGAWG